MSFIKYRGEDRPRDVFNRPRQLLVFIEFFDLGDRLARPAVPIWVPGKPDNVWTLWPETKADKPPQLPYTPEHRTNAFHEDYIHDWNIDSQGRLRYFSRITEEPVWVLLEYNRKDHPDEEQVDWTNLSGR